MEAKPIFQYVRPPLGSLDPWTKPADLIRLACLATNILHMHYGLAYASLSLSLKAVVVAIGFDQRDEDMEGLQATLLTYCSDPALVLLVVVDDADGDTTPRDIRVPSLYTMLDMVSNKRLDYVVHSDADVPVDLARVEADPLRSTHRLRFHETWGDWDLTKPSRVLTREQLQSANVPEQSVLSDPGMREFLATVEHMSRGKWTFVHGPTAKARYAAWSPKIALRERARFKKVLADGPLWPRTEQDTRQYIANQEERIKKTDAVRQRLGRHLAQIATETGLLINMANDPMCPWKGMRFFHGTDYKDLQKNVDPAAGEGSSGTHNQCMLTWDEYVDEDTHQAQNRTSFVTPYFAKGFSYGLYVHTYKLSVEGKSLKMLDLRNDYVVSTHNHAELDPFRLIYELAGLPHGGRNRVEKAVDLYHLFKDTGVDGLILNADVEWIFFHAASVLDWVPPTDDTPLTELLLNNASDEDVASGASVRADTRDDLSTMVRQYVTSRMDGQNVDRFLTSGNATGVELSLSSLPIMRWTLDSSADPYMSQFAAGANAAGAARIWNAFQMPAGDVHGDVQMHAYECDYHTLWRSLEADFDNMWMGDTIREGGQDRRTALPYHQLVQRLRELRVTLLVHLPNGFTQLVPPVQQPDGKYDRRMFIIKSAVPVVPPVQLLDMPIRDVYRPRATIAAATAAAVAAASSSSSLGKRSVGGEDEEEKGKKHRLAGKLCIS